MSYSIQDAEQPTVFGRLGTKTQADTDLALQRRIDELRMEHLFARERMLRGMLRQEGIEGGHMHVATLIRRMGIEVMVRRK